VLLVAFGYSMAASFYNVAIGLEADARGPLVGISAVVVNGLAAAPAFAVLLFVLSRRGRTLRDIGVRFAASDLPLAILLCLVADFPRWSLAWQSGHLHPESLALTMFVSYVILAAKEEVIVRAFLMTEVLELTGVASWAVGASFCFQSLYHLYQGRIAALYHAWVFFYALFYLKTRRITPVVLAHALGNWMLHLYQ
jgi:membrane protease YdiL (CAAX protease family)